MNDVKKVNRRIELRRNCQFFLSLNIPQNCPSDCDHLITILDMYDTGDSPTGYDCDANSRKDCPLWDQVK